MNKIIFNWHKKLDMPKYNLAWHQRDIEDELLELKEARGIIHKWSELSDIAYTYSRALWSGHAELKLPISRIKYYFGLIYMFPKYQLRWNFFVDLGKKLNSDIKIREVRNPARANKLLEIAEKYNFDKKKFSEESKKMLKRRFFLK